MLSKKSKIERGQKSRKWSFLGYSAAAILCGAGTKVRGRFSEARCGPLTSPRTNGISGPKNFRSSPQKDFCNSIGGKAEETNAVGPGQLLPDDSIHYQRTFSKTPRKPAAEMSKGPGREISGSIRHEQRG
jgi:hypothetical protein